MIGFASWLQAAAHAAGFHVQRRPGGVLRWSDRVDDYYPVELTPRWGFGRPAHGPISAFLERGRRDYERTLGRFSEVSGTWEGIPMDRAARGQPYWTNGWFNPMDAAVLMGMIVTRAPRTYLEVGSGNSTMFARHAVRHAGVATRIISLDPEPRAEVDALCDEVIRVPMERCDMQPFEALEAGDVLMIDSSHRVLQNSDVTALFMDVVPRIRSGVIVHIHDIFWPLDYPPYWTDRLYSEQYLLGAMMLTPTPPFRVLMPNKFVSVDAELRPLKRHLFRDDRLADPRFYFDGGVSFWMEMV